MSTVYKWLCQECGEHPIVDGAYVGYSACCGCYDGNHHLIGGGRTIIEAVADWREAMLDDGRVVTECYECTEGGAK